MLSVTAMFLLKWPKTSFELEVFSLPSSLRVFCPPTSKGNRCGLDSCQFYSILSSSKHSIEGEKKKQED